MLGLVRRLLIALLWGWLVIGSLVFLTGKCSNEREGAFARRARRAGLRPVGHDSDPCAKRRNASAPATIRIAIAMKNTKIRNACPPPDDVAEAVAGAGAMVASERARTGRLRGGELQERHHEHAERHHDPLHETSRDVWRVA